jgi:hypothetical protein
MDDKTASDGAAHVSLVSPTDHLTPLHHHSNTTTQDCKGLLLEQSISTSEVERTALGQGQDGPPDTSRSDIRTMDQHQIHWLSPAILILFLIAGTCFAIGHHFYYNSLNGQIVGTVAQQQWSLR